jgi:ribosome biogenesis GTPase
VSRVDRGRFQLLSPQGVLAVATTGVSPVCVGDWCTVGGVPDSDGRIDTYVLGHVLPRRTALVRQSSGARVESQALAANIDVVMVVVPLDRAISRRQIERFLALAWDSGAQPVLVLSKLDLIAEDAVAPALAEVTAVSGDLTVLLVSVVTGAGMDEVAALVQRGQTVALLGTSGSGKSSLVNALMGSDVVQTGEVRLADSKGRHTTAWRELVIVPSGGALIDTPGLRELGMWVDEEGIDCRFNDCAHLSEPGCAVLAAIAAGALPSERLDSYRKLLGEAAFAARKNDNRMAKEAQKVWKQRTIEGRRNARPRTP